MLSLRDYRALADFRYHIRRFLHFSEGAARAEGLEPQQHQLLLGVKALDREDGPPSISELADWLLIRHHSAVGLVDRLEERGMVQRVRGESDRRRVGIRLTEAGEAALQRLAMAHREELGIAGPALVGALGALLSREHV